MFTFGFSADEETILTDAKPGLDWDAAKEVTISEFLEPGIDTVPYSSMNAEFHLKLFPYEKALQKLPEENCIAKAEHCHSDLIPSKYEGGLKIWECTEDLECYLAEQKIWDSMAEKAVLDLGCGAGILGILALQHKAEIVHFQDYNEEVLQHLTSRNVLLNKAKNQSGIYRFFSGDWESFANMEVQKYDFILSCETIYNPDCHNKLLSVFKKTLSDNGTMYPFLNSIAANAAIENAVKYNKLIRYLAAKTYYFGVGGGLRQFEDTLQQDATFTSSIVWKCSDGVQREILKIVRV
ncbi:hypothetical protein B566_EDAN008843 [Ephemera danica]|nr:hypothetical protein B566_EDAN008843 [Ephemera danica]